MWVLSTCFFYKNIFNKKVDPKKDQIFKNIQKTTQAWKLLKNVILYIFQNREAYPHYWTE